MENLKVRDVKKALRLCGWVLVFAEGYRFFYCHPRVPGGFSLWGKDNDEVSPELLLLVERQLGLCLRPVLA